MKEKKMNELMQAYLENRITEDGYAELWAMIKENKDDHVFRNLLNGLWQKTGGEQISIPGNVWDEKLRLLKEQLGVNEPLRLHQRKPAILYKFRWAAAVLLITACAVLFLLFNKQKPDGISASNKNPVTQKNDKAPGGNKAFLTLHDGSLIPLDGTANGTLALQGNTHILKQKDGQLIYNATGNQPGVIYYNTLTTPRGGQYRITLADGTRVWLNASSSIRYPVFFSGKERKVEMSGEAYFEVAKDPSSHFKVTVAPRTAGGEMQIEVTGTHFNINGYDNEKAVKTTLLEGSVIVNTGIKSSILKPGQQASFFATGEMNIADNADTEQAVAWKDGNFQFENSDITSVMHQLERWYDMEVTYAGTINKHFSGTITRSTSLSKVLEMLERTGEVKFTVSGTKIVVSP